MVPIKFNETTDYQYMDILGVEGVFSNLRIDEKTLPEGFHKYSLRHGDDGNICSVAKNIMVNHAGDFITKSTLECAEKEEYVFESDASDEWGFTDKEFDFEAFFGKKLALDTQIKQADEKRIAQLGGGAKGKNQEREPADEEFL